MNSLREILTFFFYNEILEVQETYYVLVSGGEAFKLVFTIYILFIVPTIPVPTYSLQPPFHN